MGLLKTWHNLAYAQEDRGQLKRFWDEYFIIEKGIYEKLLTNPNEVEEGSIKALAEKYEVEVLTMVGFADGINDSLVTKNDLEEASEDSIIKFDIDKEKLYKNMVAAGADWLYELPQWNDIFDDEKRKELYKEQKSSGTIVNEIKPNPNDPCPCGSGKKYKKCCANK